ncbi:hypothetical protein [Streptomyces arenae]|uniref:hypothetical protein n=1 Tax=Streptomyces arenae TaxID=29301 RepID=UPI002659ADA5|nr:hypothetical protein [Streptomyces arenae]MCG7204433.1 hypothetical protein [Streptomyces arenae]
MVHRRRKPASTARSKTCTHAPTSPRRGPKPLWQEAGRRAILALAGSTGPLLNAVVEWWLCTH